MMTRKEYMELPTLTNGAYDSDKGLANLRAYYGQYVTPEIIAIVVKRFGLLALMKSTDRHLNDIEIQAWDRLAGGSGAGNSGAIWTPHWAPLAKLKECGDGYSLSAGVCILKTAATMALRYRRGRSDYDVICNLANWTDAPIVEVTADEYDDMLGCVPPIYVDGGFLVGETLSGDERGPVYAHYAERDGKFYARYSNRNDPYTFIPREVTSR